MTDCQSNGGWLIIRVTKNPEERRKEIVEIAEKLFIKKAYTS